jgi:hypothetical protein
MILGNAHGRPVVVIDVTRFEHLAPEEIVATLLLVVVLAFALFRPGPISQLFESPYSTPAPGGGPARQILAPTASPVSEIPRERAIGVGFPVSDPHR